MKTKNRNLLTVILALLCTVAVAIGVSFALPEKESITADATAIPIRKSTFSDTFSGQSVGGYDLHPARSLSDFAGADPTYGSCSFGGGAGTMSASGAMPLTAHHSVAYYISFKAEIKVPKYTQYKVTYKFDIDVSGSTSGNTNPKAGVEILYFGNSESGGSDKSSTVSFSYNMGATDSIGNAQCSVKGGGSAGGTVFTPEITYTNNTSVDKTCTAYFGFYCNGTCAGNGGKIQYIANVNGSEKVTTEKLSVTVDKTTDEYDDSTGNTFTFTYDKNKVTLDSLTYTDTAGSSSALSNTLDSAGKCTLTDGAGTYSFVFDIINGGAWNNDPDNLDQSTYTITVTITPKKLDVPTITVPQEYSGSALTFVLADFNSGTNISMDGVTPPTGCTVTGAGGAALTDTTGTFEATNVGKYTVSLSLRDTANYMWSDGTITSKTVDFEITQKELLSVAPISSKVNSIGGAEWKYGDSTVTVTITDNRATGEVLDLFIYYDNKSYTLTGTTVGNVTTVTMPSDIAVGTHTFYVELNGTAGDNANYKITKNNTLSFVVTSATIDPSTYGWTYTKDGTAGGTITDGTKLPFELKAGSTVDGVKYEVSIQIPASDTTTVVVDTAKYSGGYQVHSGDKVGKYKTVVALKSTDPTFEFDVSGVKQSTIEVELNWEIKKGDFDLSGVIWEYTTNNGASWADYDPAAPPQYNDGNYVTVRVKSGSLPLGLTLDGMYTGDGERIVGNYTATISSSDLVYNTDNFNAPDTSKLILNWEIAKKNLFTAFTNSREPYANANYSGNIIIKKLKFSDTKYENYVEYKYYDLRTGLEVTLDQIKNDTDPTDEKKYKVEAYIKPAYDTNYEVLDNGATPQDQFKTGSKNLLATATVDGKDGSTPITVEYDGNDHYDLSVIKVVGDDGLTITDYTVTYYKGKTPVAGNELAAGELPKDAGDYCIEIILGPIASAGYILGDDWFTVTVEAKGIAIPTLDTITFNGKEQNFVDFLSGDDWNTYGPAGKDIIKVDGKLSDRNVSAGNYSTTLTITDTNYKWIYPSSKSVAKYSRAVGEYKVTGDDVVATYNWNLTPLIVDTTNMWSKGKNGATLNLPQNIRDFIAGGTLEVGYRYYDSDGNFIEEPELKGGRSFKVEAVFAGDDAERNIQFLTGDNEFGAVSKGIDYTVPTNGAAAFFGNVKEALAKSYLGLPLWCWLLIALAVLILLIIIIVVACKRRKSKEEKEKIKARKEEERLRKEEERQRREEERAEEKRRREEQLEHERELAKAKQEAELEKIRAQAQAAAGAGMASMAVQQQPQQQQAMPVSPQPVQQVQSVDNELLKEMRQQMAELRADNKATQAQLQAMQNSQNNQAMPQPMQYQQPMYQQPMYPQYQQMPMQMPMPQYGGDPTLARLEAQLNAMQAEQRARYDAEQRIELAAMRAEQHVDRDSRHSVDLAAMREHINGYNYNRIPDYSNQGYNNQPQPNSVEALGAIVAAALKNINAPAQPVAELPQQTEASAPSEVKYPSDAVITTTTTVDTTKNKPIRREEDDGRIFDSDGFYDNFE
ncbi:MAG: hypothetical protein K2N22_00205 [Clostridia bacterium]|nr:hypothetical protein [Clostridia bacterium]